MISVAKIKREPTTKVKKKESKKRIRIDSDIEVIIVNFTSGIFFYKDDITKNRYQMNNFGDEEIITVGELVTMKNRNRAFLENMWIIIADVLSDEYTVDDVIKYLRLENAYGNNLSADVLDKFVRESDIRDFEHILKNTGKPLRRLIHQRALYLERRGKLRDMNKIHIISELSGNPHLMEDVLDYKKTVS